MGLGWSCWVRVRVGATGGNSAPCGTDHPHPALSRQRERLKKDFLSWTFVAAALLLAALTYRNSYRHHFAVVRDPAFPQWWQWTDQGRYYQAVKAWAGLSLDPSQHWYFAGYPLLGALFFQLDPGHPFYLVDLLCLLLSSWLIALLAGRLGGDASVGRLVGAATIVGAIALSRYEMKAFIEPWTTSPTAPLSLGALLLAIRLWDRPTSARAAALGLVTASVLVFRPIDVLPLALAITLATAWALRADLLRVAIAGAAGTIIPIAIAFGSYVAVFGLTQSLYLQQSANTGFEWRLIPLRWVTLFVSPLPEFRQEFSMSQTFPWIVPGVAGMIACLVSSRGPARLRHGVVTGAVLLHCLLYLAYRDMHPPGLFQFGNYHYFKWCIPVFGLYAAFLLTEIVLRRHWAALAAGLAVCAFLFSWRMAWREIPAPFLATARLQADQTLSLPRAPRSVYEGLFVPADGGVSQIYLSSYTMRIGDRQFHANEDFKAFPVPGGLVFTVLRPMPKGAAEIAFPAELHLRPEPLHLLRAKLFWRWPRLAEVATTYYRRWFHEQ